MFRRLQALYLRYAAVHEDRLRGMALGPIGRRIGQVERVVRRGDRVEIAGWADAARLCLTWPGGEVEITPDIHRADVAARFSVRPDTGFTVAVPASAHPLTMRVELANGAPLTVTLSHPADPAPPSAHHRLRRAFVRDLVRAAPALIRYIRTPTERSKTAMKRALGLEILARGPVLEGAWLTPSPKAEPTAQDITIVLPIHNALDCLTRCLARVTDGTDLPWHLVAVEDASTDPNLRPWLTEWAKARPDQVTLITLDQNLGFIGAVNTGLNAARARGGSGPVVLLNSDAMVPSGWASRLTAPFQDANVASVTPMSNAAEVLSVPTIGPGLALRDGEVDRINDVAKALGPVALPNVPTGVGFCMAMSRDWLARVPHLDPAFGRGYGEEVDWCQKTTALGARHLCQPRLFVEHVGGQSFGSAEKIQRMRAANAMIARRYPGFDAGVQRFIADDPLATPRLALAVALAGARVDRLSVYLAHSLGGGAEMALLTEIAEQEAAVVLRVGGPHRWQVEVHVDGHIMAGQTNDLSLVARLLAHVPQLALIFSCAVGDRDPVTVPEAMLSLRREGKGDTITLRCHDFFPLSPSYTLLGQDGFAGVPDNSNTDPAHTATRPDGTKIPLQQWRDAWGKLIAASAEVTVFSPSSAALFTQAFPYAPVQLRPHRLTSAVRPVAPHSGTSIGILGNINLQKGALILRQIAAAHPERSFVVIGHADSSIALPRNVALHGSYLPEEIADLAMRYGVSGWLVPAIWPETFSFSTREALATGLPVVGFALGAQGEALEAAINGATVPMHPSATAPARLFAALQPQTSLQEAAE